MPLKQIVLTTLLIVGLIFVYHNFVANKGSLKGALAGLGINR